jgi:hypothetical protein
MFCRPPTEEEREAIRASRAANPNTLETATTAVASMRNTLCRTVRETARSLSRTRAAHDLIGAAAVEAELGAADYAELQAEFNGLRAAILAVDPAAEVPAAL